MKNQLTLFLILWITGSVFSQNIINVNNTSSGVTTQYTTLAAAVAGAVNGDIIYLYPSSTSYGSATINKKLTIIGPGYYVAQNPSLEITSYISNGITDNLTFTAGSNGSLITGIDLNYLTMDGQANIAVNRCKVRERIFLKNTNNILIEGCYFERIGGTGVSAGSDWFHVGADLNNNSLNIRNNLFYARTDQSGQSLSNSSSAYYNDNVLIGVSSNAIIENNVFRDHCHFSNSFVRNNIFISTGQANCTYCNNYTNSTIQNNGSGNSFLNNVLVANQSGLGSTNIINVPEATIFEGWPTQGSRSFDDRFMLKAGSPAIGAGIGGIDCGVFSNATPYKLSGIPFIPLIYQINAPPNGNAANGINVNVKIRANN